MTLPREERIQRNSEQMREWYKKLGEVLDRNDDENNYAYLEEYSGALWQHSKVLKKEFRIKE